MDYGFNYTFIWRHFDRLSNGLILSLELAAVSILIGMAIGLSLALLYNDGGRWSRWGVAGFVETIRNVPLLLLVYLVFYGIPTVGGFTYGATTSFVITLSVYSAAYLVEVFRAGFDAVPKGIIDAGKSIGLTFVQRLLYVIFPQAVRRFLPPWINAVTEAVKGTSLISLIGVVDLMLEIQKVIGRTYEPMPLYVMGAIIYFLINYNLSTVSRGLERRFAYIRE